MEFLKDYEYYEDYNIKKYNTYRLNVICKYIVFIKNINELIKLIDNLNKNNIKYMVLGNGSNVIFKNDYYDGVIINLNKLTNMMVDDNLVYVEAGYFLPKLSRDILDYGLTGLEFASGIPGFLGASIAMNAGAYNKDMASIVKKITVIDNNNKLRELSNKELNFMYRDSFLKKNKDYICVSAVLELEKGSKEEALSIINSRRDKRMSSQPLEFPSAGSVFRNPPNMHAGELIEKCNLKGFNINGAEVSTKHANFIINSGNCTGKDILELINIIKKEVKNKFNVDLVLEQEIIY